MSNEKQKNEHSGRREFLQDVAGIGAAGLLAAAGFGAEQISAEETGPKLERPLSVPRFLKMESRQVGNIKETQATIEVTGSNGVRMVTDSLVRETEDETTKQRTITTRTLLYPSNSNTPVKTTVHTIIADITKGQVVGDRRHDQVSLTMIDSSGIRTIPAMVVKRPVQDPYAGLSEQEIGQRMFADKGLL